MGSICSAPRKVFTIQARSCPPKLGLRTDSQKDAFLTQMPKTYEELLQETATKYKVPAPFLVLKTMQRGRELSISDEETFSAVLAQHGPGNLIVTVFFPSRSAIALKSTENPTTAAFDRSSYIQPEKETWNILHPVPIDVEVASRSSVTHSRNSSLFLFRGDKEPRTSQCLTGFLLLFDAPTQDSFKYFSDVIDEGSRSVQLPSGSFVITGGQKNPGQHIKLDSINGAFRRMENLGQTRYSHTSVCVQGSVWVIAGISGSPLSHCEMFDNDKWLEMPKLNVARAWCSASTLNTVIFVYGGKEETSIENYENGEWHELSVKLPQPLAMPGVFHLDEELVLVAGGRSGSGDVYDAIKLNLDRGLFEELSSLPVTDHFTGEPTAHKEVIFFQGSVATYKFDPANNNWACVE